MDVCDASFGGLAEEHLVLHDLADFSGVGAGILQGWGGGRLLLMPIGLGLGRGGRRGVELGEEQTRRQDRCAEKNRTYVIALHRVAPVAGKYTQLALAFVPLVIHQFGVRGYGMLASRP